MGRRIFSDRSQSFSLIDSSCLGQTRIAVRTRSRADSGPARTQPASEGRAINHLGLELPSSAAVEEYLKHVKHQGVKVREQLNVNCCYANQSKFWVIDPDGIEWEIYHVNYDLVEKHGGGVEELTADVRPEIA